MGIVCDKKTKSNIDSDNEISNKKKPNDFETINLIKEIRAKHIMKIIFSTMEEKLKLNIIKYNKKYQNILDINVNSYYSNSEKDRVIEKNGICKEYIRRKGALVFEGEFKNGNRNGKGKEYDEWNNKVIFEGEYLNGKRNGKGKEYDKYDGKVIFEGEYLNGKRNGKGKQFRGHKLAFEGVFANGYRIEGKGYDFDGNLDFDLQKDGKLKEYYKGKLKYKGDFKNGQRNGKGKEYSDGKLIFEGEFKYGKQWNGKSYRDDFQGDILDGKRWNGKGKEYKNMHVGPGCTDFENKLVFQGVYTNGKKKGIGYLGKNTFKLDEENGIIEPINSKINLNESNQYYYYEFFFNEEY